MPKKGLLLRMIPERELLSIPKEGALMTPHEGGHLHPYEGTLIMANHEGMPMNPVVGFVFPKVSNPILESPHCNSFQVLIEN